MQSLSKHALIYGQLGWHIFPLPVNTKEPLQYYEWADHNTNDVLTIEEWWKLSPNANIGLTTGTNSGIIVLDADIYKPDCHFNEFIAGHEPLPKTLTAQTGNQGTHYYFKHPKDGNKYGNKSYSEKVWPYQGVDIRGDGGYVVAPPSVVKEKPYRWINRARIAPCPPWLLEVIKYEPVIYSGNIIEATSIVERKHEFYGDCVQHLKQRAIPYLVQASKHPAVSGHGGDNATYGLAGNLASLDCDGVRLNEFEILELMLESPWNSACIPPWNRRELSKKVQSALHNGSPRSIKPCELCPHRKKYAHVLNRFGGAK